MLISEKDTYGLVLPISHIVGPCILNLMVESGMSVSVIDEMKPKNPRCDPESSDYLFTRDPLHFPTDFKVTCPIGSGMIVPV